MSVSFPNANHAAFATITTLGAVTIGSTVAAATVTATVAMVAYTVLAVTAGALSIASMTAWVDQSSTSAKAYFENFKSHSGYAIAGTFQLVAQTFLQALIQGLAGGIATRVHRNVAGPDITFARY